MADQLVRCKCTSCKAIEYWHPAMLRFGVRHVGCIRGGVFVPEPEPTPPSSEGEPK